MGAPSACTHSPPADTLILDVGLCNGEGITSLVFSHHIRSILLTSWETNMVPLASTCDSDH